MDGISVFVIDPRGNIAHTKVLARIFEHLLDWPSLDWLGPLLFNGNEGVRYATNSKLSRCTELTSANGLDSTKATGCVFCDLNDMKS